MLRNLTRAIPLSFLALPLLLTGCSGGGEAQGTLSLPPGASSSEKVAVPAPTDPNSVAAGGSGMPIPGGSGSGPVVLKDAPPDPTGASSGGSGMPIPTGR